MFLHKFLLCNCGSTALNIESLAFKENLYWKVYIAIYSAKLLCGLSKLLIMLILVALASLKLVL